MLNLQETMRRSPEHNRNTAEDCEFDPQVDFSKFLEEAKHYARTTEVNQVSSANVYTEDGKKSKRSWKTSLFSWWRTERKKKIETRDTGEVHRHVSGPRRGHVSGPIYGSCKGVDAKLRRQTSGSAVTFLNLNNAWKGSGDEMPYMCLKHVNNPHHLRSYGPVYLVT